MVCGVGLLETSMPELPVRTGLFNFSYSFFFLKLGLKIGLVVGAGCEQGRLCDDIAGWIATPDRRGGLYAAFRELSQSAPSSLFLWLFELRV